MEQHTISNHQIASFAGKLQEDERSHATIENYLRHIRAFAAWAGEQAVTKELVASWKEHLTGKDYRPGTVNTMLVSLNRFLGFLGWHDCVVKTLRIQRRLFREDSKELTREEYEQHMNEFLMYYYGDGWEYIRRYIDATYARIGEESHFTHAADLTTIFRVVKTDTDKMEFLYAM